ncbi:MAG: BMP family ABC transporter substrate-binding protein, partial [Hyphomicrobiaceae bacterium]
MKTLQHHRTHVRRLWHAAVLAAFAFSLLVPFPATVHASFNNKVGLVSDVGGFDDNSFNEMAQDGLEEAKTAIGIAPTYYESASESDYATYLQQCADEGNGLCLAVGFLMQNAVETAATNNPTVKYAIYDSGAYHTDVSNLRSVFFDEKQAGYLAGALAGKMTASDVIGVVAGMRAVPAVVAFVAGYQNGAQCANANVDVLIDYTETFSDPGIGADSAAGMMASGADVIFSAAGPTGSGGLLYATQNGAWGIGVDNDAFDAVFGSGSVSGADKLLSSAMKNVDNAVYHTIEDYVGGVSTWAGNVRYGVAEGGVSLAPYHLADASIPGTVKTYVESVKVGLQTGSINANHPCPGQTGVGLVTDSAGVYDNSFNSMAYAGLMNAQVGLGITPMLYESTSSDDYAAKLAACAEDGNALCFGVGFTMGDAVAAAADAYGSTHFAILDYTYNSAPGNLRGIWFDTKSAAYLAGALAGKMTTSDKIAAIGGMSIPTVVDFTAGYQNGAQCANAAVDVMTTYVGNFDQPDDGAAAAAGMIADGADVIFAPAGTADYTTGGGAILYSAGEGVWSIGVDTDAYYTLFAGGDGSVPGADKLLTSSMKQIDNAVYMTIDDEVGGGFTSGNVLYGLNEGGVGLAPYHDAEINIPTDVQDYIDTLAAGLADGSIDVNDSCRDHSQIGLVADPGGIWDNSFNQMAYDGLIRAQVGQDITPMLYTTGSSDDYAPQLAACAEDGNDLCFGVGFTMADAVSAAATTYPTTHFAILDLTYDTYPGNLRGIWFNIKQASYLAGVLAAEMTTSDNIGAIGGMEIPSVTDFVDGFRNGAQCTNPAVNVYTAYAGTFVDPAVGETIAGNMITAGADVIFPPAGSTANGAIQAAVDNNAWVIGVDTDWYYSLYGGGSEPGADKLLTSVLKRIDNAVYMTIADELAGGFTPGTEEYGLADDGVGIAPYHDADSSVPDAVKAELVTVRDGILSGDINVDYGCRPRFHAQVVERSIEGYSWLGGSSVDMTLDDPGNGTGIDFTDSATADSSGTVIFSNLGGFTLVPGTVVTLSHDDANPSLDVSKTLTVSTLNVTNVNINTDTVSGTGPEGAQIGVQLCDNTGCLWVRSATVASGVWSVNFAVPGTGSNEQLTLDIVPGTTGGEALQSDEDGDITDHAWQVS